MLHILTLWAILISWCQMISPCYYCDEVSQYEWIYWSIVKRLIPKKCCNYANQKVLIGGNIFRGLWPCLNDNKIRCKKYSFFKMKSKTKQQNRNSYIPKMCVDLGPGGLQQVVEMRGRSCWKIRGSLDKETWKVVTFSKPTALWRTCILCTLTVNVKSYLTATRKE